MENWDIPMLIFIGIIAVMIIGPHIAYSLGWIEKGENSDQ